MKLFLPVLNYVAATSSQVEIKTGSHGHDLGRYFNDGTKMQINMMRDAILLNQLNTEYYEKLDALCDPCRPQATLEEIMTLLPLPDLRSGDGDAEKKLEVFVSVTCDAVNCRDRVADCASRSYEGICEKNIDWAQQYCPQTCGCQPKTCTSDDHIPGAAPEQVTAYLESEEDAEHSSQNIDIPMHEAIKYLDPSTILAQFDPNVQKTLQAQICFVPDANTRIIASNELLKVLAEDENAKILNSLSPKLPMYLEAIPDSMKNVLANDVICGGYIRNTTADACLGQRLTENTSYCRARLPRFTYNKDTGLCESANYDGCYKTENRFITKDSCEDTCKDYKAALMKVQQQKLQKFMASLTPDNLRQSMLLMFGRKTSDDSTENLIKTACNIEQGNIRPEFRDTLCNRLYSVFNAQIATSKKISDNPVTYEKEVCNASIENREVCTDKPRRGFKQGCEEAGCCWDPQPQVKYAKWKHYCFKKSVIHIKPVVPIKQESTADSEHSSTSCDVGMNKRTFCAARNSKAKNIAELQKSCEEAGCCFEQKPNGGVFYKWKLSCFNPN